jgi:hypothetical protein
MVFKHRKLDEDTGSYTIDDILAVPLKRDKLAKVKPGRGSVLAGNMAPAPPI